VLRSPKFELPFILQTDAPDRGVAAVLSQIENNEEHRVAYYSKKLLPREQLYSTVEKECLAIKLGMYAFCVYLFGHMFPAQTDHRALEWLSQLKDSAEPSTAAVSVSRCAPEGQSKWQCQCLVAHEHRHVKCCLTGEGGGV
jgi:phospholipid-translocating ATPase